MTSIFLSVAVFGMIASIAIAQEQTAVSPEVHFDEVIPAQEMLQREIVDESGVIAGFVDDVVLDVHYARVALVVINCSKSAAGHSDIEGVAFEQLLIVPSVIQGWKSGQPLKLSIPIIAVQNSSTTMAQKPLTSWGEEEMAAIYKHYDADLYWRSPKGVDASPSLMSVDELDGKLIRDADRKKFGRIEEVLLSPEKNWSIAFIAMSQFKNHKSGADRIAIPLSAFARRRSSATWMLDVPGEAKLLGTTFPAGEWPKQIDAGWSEFTHVKYGASVEGGMQTLDHPKDLRGI